MGVIFCVDNHMSIEERLLLYALVRGTRTQRVLEIGSQFGASASVIAAALQDAGGGIVVGVDPAPRIDVRQRRYFGRLRLVRKASPGGHSRRDGHCRRPV